MEENRVKKEPLVSILVPIYKVETYIGKCAKSLFDQTYDHIEYIFVDDYTPDRSMEILQMVMQSYPQRIHQIKILRNKGNRGIAAVRNKLLENATGKYVLFVDSDDWVEHRMVSDFVMKAEESNADIVCGNLLYENETGSEYHDFYARSNKMSYLKDISSGKIKTYLYLLFTKRELYVKNGLSFVAGINVGEDYIMYNKLFFHASNIQHLAIAYYHYFRGNFASYSMLSKRNIEDRIKAIDIVEQYWGAKGILVALLPSLNKRKFETKKEFIVNPEFRDFESWRATFPESNYSWKGSNIGKRNKLICLLVSLHLDGLAKLFL